MHFWNAKVRGAKASATQEDTRRWWTPAVARLAGTSHLTARQQVPTSQGPKALGMRDTDAKTSCLASVFQVRSPDSPAGKTTWQA